MGGAFVAVADDASAAYWNPAGFASGASSAWCSTGTQQKFEAGRRRRQPSACFMALGMPAAGLSYYRCARRRRPRSSRPRARHAASRAVTLVTHQPGSTLRPVIVPGVAVGATLKLVRGLASSVVAAGLGRDGC